MGLIPSPFCVYGVKHPSHSVKSPLSITAGEWVVLLGMVTAFLHEFVLVCMCICCIKWCYAYPLLEIFLHWSWVNLNADWHSLPLLSMTTTRTETTHWPISSMAGSIACIVECFSYVHAICSPWLQRWGLVWISFLGHITMTPGLVYPTSTRGPDTSVKLCQWFQLSMCTTISAVECIVCWISVQCVYVTPCMCVPALACQCATQFLALYSSTQPESAHCA